MAGMAAWTHYNDFRLNLCKKLMDLSADAIKVALVTSGSTAISATLTPATYGAGLNNELTTANGYTATGVAPGSVTLVGGGATATVTLDCADAVWTASGAGFTARAAVLYDSTSGHLICFANLDSTPADVTVAAGNTLTIQIANITVLS